jgi:transcriptional regulator with XRE-family HTH domain
MQVGGLITSVKTIQERATWARERLGLTQKEVAELSGVSQGTIGNLESGARKNPRELLTIARALKVRPDWLKYGTLPIEEPGNEAPPSVGGYPKGVQVVTTWKLVPLLPWDMVSEMYRNNTDSEVADLPKAPASPDVGPAAKFVQMPDDSMVGRINQGDILLFDPHKEPSPRCVVLVRTKDGSHVVRMYRARTGGAWDAVPENDGYATLRSDVDELKLIAVAGGRWQTDF